MRLGVGTLPRVRMAQSRVERMDFRGTKVVVVAMVLYIALFPLLALPTRGAYGILSTFPAVAAALAWGVPGSAIVLVLLPVDIALLHVSGMFEETGWSAVITSHLGLLLLTLGVGSARQRFREQFARVLAAETALRQSEQYFSIVAEAATDGLWSWEIASDSLFLSARWMALLGEEEADTWGARDLWFDRIHPDDHSNVVASFEAHIAGSTPRLQVEHRLRKANGRWLWVLVRGLVVRDADGVPEKFSGWLSDIHRRRTQERMLRHAAFHDGLTGLSNRALLVERLEHALAKARRRNATRFAVILLDIDSFKEVNDAYGHPTGDLLLKGIGARLSASVRPGDTVARLGGDEFVLLLEDIDDDDGLVAAGGRVQRELGRAMRLGERDVRVRSSMGAVWVPSSGATPADLIRDADIAMYRAKADGGGSMVIFDEGMRAAVLGRAAVTSALQGAADRGEFRLVFQPVVDTATGRATAIEALVRWNHPTEGLIGPNRFIPTAESTGLIVDIGRWVLEDAVRRAAEWRKERDFNLAVNVSPVQLRDPRFPDIVEAACVAVGFPPTALILEITETAMMADEVAAQRAIVALRERGIRIAIDDFGTGWSSLAALHRFPIDALKIDGAFVQRLPADPDPHGIVGTIVALGTHRGHHVVAEGVETRSQFEILRALGVLRAQGYYFSPPVSSEEVPETLARASLLPE